jgi:hypothetical protein
LDLLHLDGQRTVGVSYGEVYQQLQERVLMRRIFVLTMAAGVVVGLALPSQASQPIITHTGPFEAVIPFPTVCLFPLTATVRGSTHSITFVDAAGNQTRAWAGGQLFVTWTRDDTLFTRTFAIAGPTFFDAAGNGIRGTGRWTTPMVGTGWVLANGNLTLDGLQDGFPLISSMKGHAVSICDLMS